MDVQEEPSLKAMRSKIRRNQKALVSIFTKVFVTVISLFSIYYLFFYNNGKPLSLQSLASISDGITTRGFGIIKGGSGFESFAKDHRQGGQPPLVRSAFYEDKPINEYSSYDVEGFIEEDTETFDPKKNKIVVVLGANFEGGVNKWKGPNEWSIERSSVLNKRQYANMHGYEIVVKDYTKAKKYSNDFREGWQKFDIIREVMQELRNGDWIWYVDLYTFIMEPELSLQELIFERLDEVMVRELSYFNPHELQLDIPFLEQGSDEPVNLLLAQDCGGFNLNSFLIKKTKWTTLLLDVLFDPVIYLQIYKDWQNGERNALEYVYEKYSWVRSRIGFIPTRLMSSLPSGACPDFKGDERFFYDEKKRDFMVNMMGCEFNRNCWDEMEFFKDLSLKLHKNWWSKLFS